MPVGLDATHILGESSAQLERRNWPAPEAVMEMFEEDGRVPAEDGCMVEDDGFCEHGRPSLMRTYGLV
jgi:hypothetical protein